MRRDRKALRPRCAAVQRLHGTEPLHGRHDVCGGRMRDATDGLLQHGHELHAAAHGVRERHVHTGLWRSAVDRDVRVGNGLRHDARTLRAGTHDLLHGLRVPP